MLSAPMGAPQHWGAVEENFRPLGTAGHFGLAKRMWEESGYAPKDIDVLQVYQNMTGLGVASLIDHGFCTAENAAEVLTFENLIVPTGKLPMNTSGGDLAEGFIHGMGLVPEAVRQIRGESVNQVKDAKLSLMTGGPSDLIMSTMLLGAEDTL